LKYCKNHDNNYVSGLRIEITNHGLSNPKEKCQTLNGVVWFCELTMVGKSENTGDCTQAICRMGHSELIIMTSSVEWT